MFTSQFPVPVAHCVSSSKRAKVVYPCVLKLRKNREYAVYSLSNVVWVPNLYYTTFFFEKSRKLLGLVGLFMVQTNSIGVTPNPANPDSDNKH